MPALLGLLLTLLPCISVAAAQESDGVETAETAASEGGEPEERIRVDPVTGRRYRHVRPEEPLRRGALSVDAWVPLAVGGAAVVLAAAALITAHRRRGGKR